MNVCIFTNSILIGGAEKQAILLAKALNKKYKVWLIVYYGEKVEQKYLDIVKSNNINIEFLNGNHFQRVFSFYKFLKYEAIDVIFSYLLTTNFIGAVIGKIAGVKYLFGGIRNAKLEKGKFIIQRFIQNHLTTKTIYNNYRGIENLSNKGFDSRKAIVIPNCFEHNNDVIIRERKEQVTILSLGRFVEQKDWFTALESIKLVRARFTNFKYYIVGYGKLENQIRKWIISNGASEYIIIVINPSNVNKYYKLADIYLQTSLFEGLSNTVMEAMSFSLPLITTDVGDNDRLVKNKKNGYLCNLENTEQVVKNILIFCNSYEKRIKFGKKSYNILKENYSNKIFQKKYLNLIGDLNK